jgi:hypothetical protein
MAPENVVLQYQSIKAELRRDHKQAMDDPARQYPYLYYVNPILNTTPEIAEIIFLVQHKVITLRMHIIIRALDLCHEDLSYSTHTVNFIHLGLYIRAHWVKPYNLGHTNR